MPLRFIPFLLLFATALAVPNADPFPQAPSIKGLQVQMADDAIALGIHHAGINVNLAALLDLSGKPTPGQKFAFDARYLASLDRQIQPLSAHGIVVYAILLAYPSKDPARDAIAIHAGARPDHKYSVGAFNTATPEGRAYLRAVSEFLAERWSGAHPEYGRVWGWIVGNEVNSHWLWYNLGRQPLASVVSEYEHAFRIIHEAVRTASDNARLYIPFDHHWAIAMSGISAEEATPGRDFLDTFAATVKTRGGLDWHVAWHPYPSDLGNPRAWADTGLTTAETTPKITFKNLEVLGHHLERPDLLWEGHPRRIILSEQGFHTLPTTEGQSLQAAAYVYAWNKCLTLPLIDAFIYHRHVDHSQEGGLNLGLWTRQPNSISTPLAKKPIYEVMRQAGTSSWSQASVFAEKIISLAK
ncbi:MAG: DUF5722 domain-containing protein [Prosthecobacter sp.]|nr:DUF5722 domain-containing protein [Prosthecobacter sp.]